MRLANMRDMQGAHGDDERDALSAAHTERTRQLYEARGALAEAVATLRSQLSALEETQALRAEVRRLEDAVRAADRRTDAVLNLRIVRWTAWPRSVLYRLRTRDR